MEDLLTAPLKPHMHEKNKDEKEYIYFLISNIMMFFTGLSVNEILCVSYFKTSMIFKMRDCYFMIFFLCAIIK